MSLLEIIIGLVITALFAVYNGRKAVEDGLQATADASATNMLQVAAAVDDYIKKKSGTFPASSTVTIDVSPGSADVNFRTPSTGSATDGIVTSIMWPGRDKTQVTPPYTVSTFYPSVAKSWATGTPGYWVQFETDAAGKFVRGLLITKTGWCTAVSGASCATATTNYYLSGTKKAGSFMAINGLRKVAYPSCSGAFCANGAAVPSEFTQDGGGATFPKATYTKLINTGQVAVILDGASSVYDSTYLRLDGTNTMTAALNMGGFNVNNGASANFSGAVNAGSVAATGQISTVQNIQAGSGANQVTLNGGGTGGITTTGSIASSSNVSATGTVSGATVQGTSTVYAGSSLVSATAVVLNGSTGVATAPNDVTITNMQSQTRVSGNPNSGPSITSVKSLLPNYVDSQSMVVATDGSTITKPICSGSGQAQIYVIPQRVRGAVNMGTWGSDVRAIDTSSTTWTIYAKDAQGQSLSSGDFSLIAKVSCSY